MKKIELRVLTHIPFVSVGDRADRSNAAAITYNCASVPLANLLTDISLTAKRIPFRNKSAIVETGTPV